MNEPIVVTRPVIEEVAGSEGPRAELIASPWHTVFVVVLLGLDAYWGMIRAARAQAGLGPERPVMYLRTIFFELLFLGIVIAGVKLGGSDLQSVLGRRWKSVGQVLLDFGVGIGLLFLSLIVGAIAGGHQQGGSSDQSIRYLLPQGSLEIVLWVLVSLTAGICEEAIFRGYLQRQLGAMTRRVWAGILLSAAAFGGVHLYQGVQRATTIAVAAVVFGWFAHWRKTVRPGMFAHALQDGIAPLLLRMMRR